MLLLAYRFGSIPIPSAMSVLPCLVFYLSLLDSRLTEHFVSFKPFSNSVLGDQGADDVRADGWEDDAREESRGREFNISRAFQHPEVQDEE